MSYSYPFTAIVEQDRMKLALILNAINPRIGGVLIRGERGSAKSTAARGLASLLPSIRVVTDCPFSCDPERQDQQCDNCLACGARRESHEIDERRIRFINLPVGATEDRVVGTLDIEKAIKHGEKHFEPGVLASANRGVLYVDEVNLLDDHVVDLILDSAAMGVNVVEREGISFRHPARFVLIGSMNPEEGELRPQLLDRFALCVDIQSINKPSARMKVLERHLEYERDPEEFCREWQAEEANLSHRIDRARSLLSSVGYRQSDLQTISELMSRMEVDGHRGDLAILKAAITHAALEGRRRLQTEDILAAAELALPHRFRRKPLQEAGSSAKTLSQQLEEIRLVKGENWPAAGSDGDHVERRQEKKTLLQT